MSKKRKILLVIALPTAVLLLAAGIVWAAVATARQATVEGKDFGEVLIDDRVVMRFQVAAGGYSPLERAQVASERLNAVLQESSDWRQFSMEPVSGLQAIYAGEQLIATVTAEDAAAADTTVLALASEWRDNIIRALGGEPPQGEAEASLSDWEGAETKWVPILDVANKGLRIGAAQIAGPKVQVEQCKAVAQLELAFRRIARIKVYVPIDSYNVLRLNRVQGVSVWAVGDVRIVRF